jgi:hypothetical protein
MNDASSLFAFRCPQLTANSASPRIQSRSTDLSSTPTPWFRTRPDPSRRRFRANASIAPPEKIFARVAELAASNDFAPFPSSSTREEAEISARAPRPRAHTRSMSSATAPRVRASAPRARLPRPTTTTTTTTRRPAAASASPLHRRSLLRRGRVAARAASASADAPPPNTPLRMIVLRHSDSCTEDASLKDHDRPLTSRGRALANGLAKALAASDDGETASHTTPFAM